jgi:hypothetical protein
MGFLSRVARKGVEFGNVSRGGVFWFLSVLGCENLEAPDKVFAYRMVVLKFV